MSYSKEIIKIANLIVVTIVVAAMAVVFISYREAKIQQLDTVLIAVTERSSSDLAKGNYRKIFEPFLITSQFHIEVENDSNKFELGPKGVFYNICTLRDFTESNSKVKLCEAADGLFLIFLSLICLFAMLAFAYHRFSAILTNRIIQRLSDYLDLDENNAFRSIRNFDQLISELTVLIKRRVETEGKIEKARYMEELSEQVAHDIRSPLAALEMFSVSLSELSEDKRKFLRNSIGGIRDIANSLSKKKIAHFQNAGSTDASKKTDLQIELLMPIAESLVTEKRIQFRDQLQVEIDFFQTVASYGMFSKIEASELKRILSNLINNSVESFPNSKGMVKISLYSENGNNVVSIKDDGKGIPEGLVSKLGDRGATFNKEGGSGLGLFHAKSTVESWGGLLEIKSQEHEGTTVRLIIPKEAFPNWFVPEIKIKIDSTVVIFDDEQSIHHIWKDRFESISNDQLNVFHFSNPNEFRTYYRKNFAELDNAIFLMDYEIINHSETGLDLIEEYGIQSQSILVTSRFEETKIRERCKSLKVRLIPKSMCGFVPIKIS